MEEIVAVNEEIKKSAVDKAVNLVKNNKVMAIASVVLAGGTVAAFLLWKRKKAAKQGKEGNNPVPAAVEEKKEGE